MQPDAFCRARTQKGKGPPCRRTAGWGTNHPGVGRCKNHGGSSPRAQLSGVIELARREAAVMGVPLDIDPHEAILECIRISAGEVQYASERIAELEEADAVGAIVTTHERPLKHEKGAESYSETVVETMRGQPAAHIWIEIRHQAMDRLAKYSKTALDAGVDERRVRIAEAQAMMLAAAIRGILEDLGVADNPEAPAIMRKHLTTLTAGTVDAPVAA